MNGRLQGGAIKLIAAGAIAVMFFRGYFTDWINAAGAALQTPPAKVPFGAPGAHLPAVLSGGNHGTAIGPRGTPGAF